MMKWMGPGVLRVPNSKPTKDDLRAKRISHRNVAPDGTFDENLLNPERVNKLIDGGFIEGKKKSAQKSALGDK